MMGIKMTNNTSEDDREGHWVECSSMRGKKIRRVQILEGRTYIVDPLNPQKKKYRGEKVKLINSGGTVLRLESEWHVKRNHYTIMDICDLKLESEDKG